MRRAGGRGPGTARLRRTRGLPAADRPVFRACPDRLRELRGADREGRLHHQQPFTGCQMCGHLPEETGDIRDLMDDGEGEGEIDPRVRRRARGAGGPPAGR